MPEARLPAAVESQLMAPGRDWETAMPSSAAETPPIGVVIVTYRAAAFIAECLESLIGTGYPDLRIVVVDNASPDGTVDAVRGWATGAVPFAPTAEWPFPEHGTTPKPIDFDERGPDAVGQAPTAAVTLQHSGGNLGFAGGVNVGLRALLKDPEVDCFWVLNPDAVVPAATPPALVRRAHAMGRFAVIGGRIVYLDRPDCIQSDGGRLHPLSHTGVSINILQDARTCPMPESVQLDYINGVSMFASREFLGVAGLMDERYFLYCEEIDWQLRRGDLPLGLEPEALILHRAGASIGSGNVTSGPSLLATYFMGRSVQRFVWRFAPFKLPGAYAICYWKLWRHWGFGWAQFVALFRGLHGFGPPESVRASLPGIVWRKIFERE